MREALAARPPPAHRRRPPSGSRRGEGAGRGGAARLLRREGGRAGREAATNPDSGAPPRACPQPLSEEGVGNMIITAQAVRPPGSSRGLTDILGAPSVPGAVSNGVPEPVLTGHFYGHLILPTSPWWWWDGGGGTGPVAIPLKMRRLRLKGGAVACPRPQH